MFDPTKRLKIQVDSFAFPYQCYFLKMNGSWPVNPDDRRFAKFYNTWSIFVICLVGVTVYFQTTFLIYTFGDILMVTENCCTTFMGIHIFLRLIHLRWNRNLFKKLLDDFVEFIWIPKGSDPKIERRCKNEMIVFTMMSAMLFALICMYCVLPLFELFADLNAPEKPFPYKMIFPYPAHEGIVYIITYTMTSFAGFVVVTTLFAEDTLFGFFIVYTCGQFKMLHKIIEDLIPTANIGAFNINDNKKISERSAQIRYCRSLGEVVKKHNLLIDFAVNLEKFCSPILLVNFTISSILICMVGFQIVTVKMSTGNLVKFVLYISSSMAQLFVLCYNGDNLINNSVKTAWKLYACNWQGGVVNDESFDGDGIRQKYFHPGGSIFTKNLVFAIKRAQKPLRITALKFSILSLQSFTTILGTSMSYFTLLRSVYESN